jgi:transcriptional regulator with XRE-family HTH domain
VKEQLAGEIVASANAPTQAHGVAGASTLERRKRLSARLRWLMDQRGLSVSAAARLVQEQLPGSSFNASNISHYRVGRSMPRPNVLRALSLVLGVDPEELASPTSNETAHDADAAAERRKNGGSHNLVLIDSATGDGASTVMPGFHVTDLPDGEALLRINQKLSWSTVIRILKVLKEDI